MYRNNSNVEVEKKVKREINDSGGNETKEHHDIYDRMFKRILTLSKKAVIGLINGEFGTNYNINSKLSYNWTEFVDDKLKKVLADTIISVNEKDSYHFEAQMYKDNQIVLRMVEYGYKHALRTWDDIPLPMGGRSDNTA